MQASTITGQLVDSYLPDFDVVITERLVIDADADRVFNAARDLDFMTVRTPLLSASFFARGLPARLSGKPPPSPRQVRLASGDPGLPGWVYLGERTGVELVFGAVGKFWQSNIEWRDVPAGEFAAFSEPGWGKIACQFLVTDTGEGRCCLTYECRTATTDGRSAKLMRRYWWLIRPFVGHVMRATLRTISAAGSGARDDRTGDTGR